LPPIQREGVPSRFSYDFFKKLGFPSSNDRPMIPLLRAMRFIDDSGAPLDRYRRYKDQNQARAVLAEGMREAYADVFAVNQQAHKLSGDELKGIFARLSGKSEVVADKMALTFKALAGHADFDGPLLVAAAGAVDAEGESSQPREGETTEVGHDETEPGHGSLALQLHHDIHVHLPSSADMAVHDAIFRALRQNFGT
jgi:hypothetical protein